MRKAEMLLIPLPEDWGLSSPVDSIRGTMTRRRYQFCSVQLSGRG